MYSVSKLALYKYKNAITKRILAPSNLAKLGFVYGVDNIISSGFASFPVCKSYKASKDKTMAHNWINSVLDAIALISVLAKETVFDTYPITYIKPIGDVNSFANEKLFSCLEASGANLSSLNVVTYAGITIRTRSNVSRYLRQSQIDFHLLDENNEGEITYALLFPTATYNPPDFFSGSLILDFESETEMDAEKLISFFGKNSPYVPDKQLACPETVI